MRFIRLRKPEDPGAPATFELAKSLAEGLFKIVGWCMVVSVLQYTASQTDSVVVSAASVVMNVALLVYITGFITWKIEFDIIPKEKRSKSWHTIVDLAGNIVISLALYLLALKIIGEFVSAIVSLQATN